MNAGDGVGQILIQVQEEVHQLREKVQAKTGNGDNTLTIEELDSALANTEQQLKIKTARFTHQLNNQVKTIPSALLETEPQNEAHKGELGTGDADITSQADPQQAIQQNQKPWYLTLNSVGKSLLPQRHAARPSPGQVFKHRVALKAVVNPENEKNRDVLHSSYSIQLPLISQQKRSKVLSSSNKNIVIGSTIDRLSALPKANRVDPLLTPPSITERDAQKGLLSLLQRGLIPPTAEITLDPPPVDLKAIQYTEHVQKTQKKINLTILDLGDGGSSRPKQDVRRIEESPNLTKVIPPSRGTFEECFPTSINVKRIAEQLKMKQQMLATSHTPPPKKASKKDRPGSSILPYPPPTTPSTPSEIIYKLAIQDGKTRKDTSEFLTFKQAYQNDWGRIRTLLEHLEKLLLEYSVPFAFVNGNKLIDLMHIIDIERVPHQGDLISVFVNAKEILETVQSKGQKYKGEKGKAFAAVTIQKNWRATRERRKFLEYRKKKWASGVFAIAWIMRVRAIKNREMLRETRADDLELFKSSARSFRSAWKRIKNSRRVVVHIPSLGYREDMRSEMYNFHVEQNNQISRICSVLDPNVDVIYLSPVTMTDEAKKYYQKLLSLKTAVDTGNVDNIVDMSKRITFIVPEVLTQFSRKNFCLSSMLKYSPFALKRIQRLIKGRYSYIVPGVLHVDDLEIARILGIPILGSEPDIVRLYSSKSGAKRIFETAGVDMPPGEYNIYSSDQLHETLSQLIINNLDVKRWLFKLDRTVSGNGIAYCDIIEHLVCYNYVLKERARFGRDWCQKWAHEPAFNQVLCEIPQILSEHAKPLNTILFPTWKDFKDACLSEGGIIEAYPPAESVTVLQADLIVEPDGTTQLLCIGDQIFGSSIFKPWGISVPQTSMCPSKLNSVCQKVADSCKLKRVVGHVSFTMVTFINEQTLEQMLWCLDMSLSHSNGLAMFELFRFMTNCRFDTDNHELVVNQVEEPAEPENRPGRFTTIKKREFVPFRYGVMGTKMYHSNLSIIHYSVFFQMCRAHGIGYDVKERQGTVFMLLDYLNRDHIGMLVVGDQLPNCFMAFGRNLNILHQEVSSPNMQGETNFKEAVTSIKEILGVATLNAREDDEESASDNPED